MLSQVPLGKVGDTLDNTQENNHPHSQSLQRSVQSPVHPFSNASLDCGRKLEYQERTQTRKLHRETPDPTDLLAVRLQCWSLHHSATRYTYLPNLIFIYNPTIGLYYISDQNPSIKLGPTLGFVITWDLDMCMAIGVQHEYAEFNF